MSTKFWGLTYLFMFNMFWSLVVCFTHFAPWVLVHALIMHCTYTLDEPLMHTSCHLTCFAYIHASWVFLDLIAHITCSCVFVMIVWSYFRAFSSIFACFWTNLYLVKFVTIFLYVLCVCSLLSMSPGKKTTAKKPLKRQRYEEDCFRDRDAFKAFSEYYKDAIIIVEREVDLPSLKGTFIPNVFRDHTWAPLLTGSLDVHYILVRKFFSNAIVEGKHLNCWVRGKEFTVSTMLIKNFLQIRLAIPDSSLPYDKRTTPILVIVPVLGGEQLKKCLLTTSFSPEMRTLEYIMLFNLFPLRNLTNLS